MTLPFRIPAGLVALSATTILVAGGCASSTEPHTAAPAASPGAINISEPLTRDLQIKTEPVENRLISTSLHATGEIRPEFGKEVSLTTRVTGRVLRILVTPGQPIASGQLLAIIDSQQIGDLEAELLEAKAKLNIARAQEDREAQIYEEQLQRPKALVAARTHYDETNVHLELTERELNRIEGLFKERIAAAKDFFVARANHAKAQAAFQQAKSDMEREERLFHNKAMMKKDYQLAQAETARARQHLSTLRQRLLFLGMTPPMVDSVLRTEKIAGTVPILAPSTGIMSQQKVAAGEIVDPGKHAFTISDLSTVSISANIAEVDMPHVKPGMQVRARVTGYPDRTFTGTISYIGTDVNPETRTVPIRARLPNPGLMLRSNMFAEIDIELSPQLVLSCPRSAVLERDGRQVVYVASPGGFVERAVKVGRTSEAYCQVVSGLSAGERVATSGSLLLRGELAGVH